MHALSFRFSKWSLAVTYFHMGRPHTIMGAEWFHFRVRKGIGWVTLAIAAKHKLVFLIPSPNLGEAPALAGGEGFY